LSQEYEAPTYSTTFFSVNITMQFSSNVCDIRVRVEKIMDSSTSCGTILLVNFILQSNLPMISIRISSSRSVTVYAYLCETIASK